MPHKKKTKDQRNRAIEDTDIHTRRHTRKKGCLLVSIHSAKTNRHHQFVSYLF